MLSFGLFSATRPKSPGRAILASVRSQTPPRRQAWSDVALKHKIYLLFGSLLILIGIWNTGIGSERIVLQERQAQAEKLREEIISSLLLLNEESDYSSVPPEIPVYIEGRVASHQDGSRDAQFVGSSGLWLNGLRLPLEMRFIYNTPDTMERQGALGCVRSGALVPYVAPETFSRSGQPLRIIGVGGCTPRLLGQFDPEQFLRERLVLPEDTVASTAGGYYGRVLQGPLSILIGIVLLLGYWKGLRRPSEDLAL